MKVLKYLFFVCFIAFETTAQNISVNDFVSRIQEINGAVTSIESDFNQLQEFSFLDEVIASSGKFYFKKPNAMKWEQLSPEPYMFVLNEGEAYSFDGVKKQKMPANSPQLVGFRRFIMGTVDGSVFQGDDFETTVVENKDKLEVLMLPQNKALKRVFLKVEMVFDEETIDLLELKFFESEEDVRVISFTNHQKNTLTDYSIFQ